MNLDSEQLEQLRDIAAYLQQIREDQSRSLEEISAKTFIPLRILRAIEAGQESILPEPVFIQGFIRRYGDALGLDGTELSHQFTVTTTPISTYGLKADLQAAAAAAHDEPTYTPQAPNNWDAPTYNPPVRRPPYLLIGLAGVAAIATLFLFVIKPGMDRGAPQQRAAQPKPSSPVAPSVPSPSPSAAALSEPSPSPEAAASPTVISLTPSPSASPTGNLPVNVALSLTDESWLEVRVDGEVKYEGILPKGTKRSWSGKREIQVSSGNAGAVSASLNNGPAQPIGAPGSVDEKTFKP